MFTRILKELFSVDGYKTSQGRVARRSTFLGLALVFVMGAYFLLRAYSGSTGGTIAAAIIALLGVWISYRVVNYPTFADFLVSVEAEMMKVSWPSKKELYANTKVVLVFMVLFTVLIFLYDVVFQAIFSFVN